MIFLYKQNRFFRLSFAEPTMYFHGKKRPAVSWAALGRELPAGQGRGSCSALHWWGYMESAVSCFGLPSTRRVWLYWSEASTGPQRWYFRWAEAERWDSSAWRTEGSRGSYQCTSLMGGSEGEGARLFSVVSTDSSLWKGTN